MVTFEGKQHNNMYMNSVDEKPLFEPLERMAEEFTAFYSHLLEKEGRLLLCPPGIFGGARAALEALKGVLE